MMNPLWGNLAGAITVVLMAVFIGIWFWAWRARHRSVFDRMARLPMQDGSECAQHDEGDRR